MGLHIGFVLFLFYNGAMAEKLFKSVPVTVMTYENDTVLLPCYLEAHENAVRVRWYKASSLIGDSADAHLLLPPRTRMLANYSLMIQDLTSEDSADYTCEIIRSEPWGPVKQMHSIEVQHAPTVKTSPLDGFLEVKKGDYVDIGCEVTGTPQPVINWLKNGEPMSLLEHRSRLRFKAEHRLLAGVYECVATNGVGQPVRGAITVVIQDAPVVSVPRSFIHTAVGLRAVLTAVVEFASPPPRVSWYREGRPVRFDDRIISIVQDKEHQLIFRSVRLSDLGNYTFRAENRLGMADVSFRLTGVPNIASFKVDSHLNKATSTSFSLIWEVDSYSTIIEYNLWLRPYYGRPSTTEPDFVTTESPAHRWSKIVVPGDVTDGPIHSALYTVRGLTPATVYEAAVTSRNAFGWSKPSAVLHFATEPSAFKTKPSTADYNELLTPILEDIQEQNYNMSQAQVAERDTSKSARETPSWVAICFFCFAAKMSL